MYSFNGDFDVSSATRSAKNISVTNKLNDHFKVSLEEQKNNLINNAESNTTTKIACSPITSINEESTNVSSCNEKTHQQDDKALHGKSRQKIFICVCVRVKLIFDIFF